MTPMDKMSKDIELLEEETNNTMSELCGHIRRDEELDAKICLSKLMKIRKEKNNLQHIFECKFLD